MSQTKITGHGGYVVREAVAGGVTPYDQNVRFDNGSWALDVQAIVPDVTESDAGGWAQGLTGLYKVNSITIEFIHKLESAAIFELSACPIGGTVTLWLRKGSTSFGNRVVNTIFRGLQVTNRNDNGDPVRCVATFEFGQVAFNVAGPAVVVSP